MSRGRRKRDGQDTDQSWKIYFDAKKTKLLEQFEQDTANIKKESDILKGVAIFVNGFTNPNAEELKRLMAAHGGTLHLYQNSATTHVIASILPNVKITKLGALPIVKPSWIVDSIDLGKLQDFRRYLLYTSQSTTQPALQFPSTTKTASDPKFLEEFYSNSRLHLIATLGSEFKQLISKLRLESDGNFPGLDNLKKSKGGGTQSLLRYNDKVIMHIDMDCFFVSVSLRQHPDLKGQPVAVTHARNPQITATKSRSDEIAMNAVRLPQRMEHVDGTSSLSEISSCSYEARKCGVRNGMFLGAAIKLCPDLKTIPYDFQDYRDVSHVLYSTLATYTLDIEAVSCDEMYVDVTEILNQSGLSVTEWATHIRSEITAKTSCPCSTGFGANRLQARLATKKAKPNGQFYIRPDLVESFMGDFKLSDLPGVGFSNLSKLSKLQFVTCRDLQQNGSLSLLKAELGAKYGETLWEQSKGVDKRTLVFEQERKSVSAEVNYGIRFKSADECWNFLQSLSIEVAGRLNEVKMKTRCVTLKVMVRAEDAPVETAKFLGHGICNSLSKSKTLTAPITEAKQIFDEIKTIYQKLGVDFEELRGLGIQLSKLEKFKEGTMSNTLKKFLELSTKDTRKIQNIARKASAKKMENFFKETKRDLQPDKMSKYNIDMSVLLELPEDIRNDVMKEYNLESHPVIVKSQKTEEESSPFNDCRLDWPKLRTTLQAWIASEAVPSTIDVDMLAKYFQKLVDDGKLDFLRVAFNFLHRIAPNLDCKWHRALKNVIASTQERMTICYGGPLYVTNDVELQCCHD